MKKYLVIGNPIEHSLSPMLHNYWIKKYNLKAIYEKKQIAEKDLEDIIREIRNSKISGINVTVPYKKLIIPLLDKLSVEAQKTQSVNTIYKFENKLIGENTDWLGFRESIKQTGFKTEGKKVFILGAGGVSPSIIYALELSSNKIFLSNRTKKKSEELKKLFPNIEILEWGKKPSTFDIVINATSIGLNKDDKIDLDFSNCNNKLFFDVIYNQSKTKFLLDATRKFENQTENGLKMFIYQAQLAFKIWHNILPSVDEKIYGLFNQ